MFNAGCRGSAKTLTGSEGIISINQTEYVHFMSCRWTIQVDPSEVLNNIQISPKRKDGILNVCALACICDFMCECMCVNVCMCAYACKYNNIYMNVCMYVYTHMYTYI